MKAQQWRRCFLAFNYLSLAALWTTAFAAEKSPFYQGKTLNVIINFAAGGPTDIESRIFAKHLPRHIPGNPTVTVQAMGGGVGLTAVDVNGEGLNSVAIARDCVILTLSLHADQED